MFVSKPDPVSNCRDIMATVTLSYDKQWRIHELRPFLGLEKCLDEKMLVREKAAQLKG